VAEPAPGPGRPLLPLARERPARLVTPAVLLRWLEPAHHDALRPLLAEPRLQRWTGHAGAFVLQRRADGTVLGLVTLVESAHGVVLTPALLSSAQDEEVRGALAALSGWVTDELGLPAPVPDDQLR